ncbi:MAG: hypothetical protein FJ387_23980 [Verrucomicrobia bacterium]|nr:hypothetical protein [Verrucomicrobiota bacterium]
MRRARKAAACGGERALWVLGLLSRVGLVGWTGLGLIQGQVRATSAVYALLHGAVAEGGGGGRAAGLSAELSLGGLGGIGRAGAVTVRHGYAGQIDDAPWVGLAPMADVTRSSAVGVSRVDPNVYRTTVTFEYGLTPGYGTVVALPDLVAHSGTQTLNCGLEGLRPGTTYHVRWVAANVEGCVASPDLTFTTSANVAPLAQADFVERRPDRGVKVVMAKLLGNDTDAEGDVLNLDWWDATSLNGASIVQDGAWLLYQPPVGFNATDTFNYGIHDGWGGSATAVVRIEVSADDAPSLNLLGVELLAGGALRIIFAGIAGRTYAIQACTTLTLPDWQTLGTATANSLGLYEFVDVHAAEFPTRFIPRRSPMKATRPQLPGGLDRLREWASPRVALLLGLGLGGSAQAQLTIAREFTVNQNIPDGGELLNLQTFTFGTYPLAQVRVTLDISGRSVGSGFNGDLYAAVGHGTGYAVLLNRPGKLTAAGLGYGDSGVDVTFADDAANGDIHVYRLKLGGSHDLPLSGPLTGVWAPDGRNVDPDAVVFEHTREA